MISRSGARRRAVVTIVKAEASSCTVTTRARARSNPARHPVPDRRGDPHLEQRAGNRDVTNEPQIAQGEEEPDAEHQEDDAEFGELLDRFEVAGESGRKRTEGHAG